MLSQDVHHIPDVLTVRTNTFKELRFILCNPVMNSILIAISIDVIIESFTCLTVQVEYTSARIILTTLNNYSTCIVIIVVIPDNVTRMKLLISFREPRSSV